MGPNPYGGPLGANAYAPPPVAAPVGVSPSDREMYLKNLHDSGYNPKDDFTAAGTMKVQ
jgi:hypothetical protein